MKNLRRWAKNVEHAEQETPIEEPTRMDEK
jgi:hypothetical protein